MKREIMGAIPWITDLENAQGIYYWNGDGDEPLAIKQQRSSY